MSQNRLNKMESEEFEEKMACKIHFQLYDYLIIFQ